MIKLILPPLFIVFVSLGLMANEEVFYQDIRFMGTDLVDEMIYDWLKSPPVAGPNVLSYADVSAPVGLDNRFTDLVENRLYELFEKNPQLQLSLAHCSVCNQMVATSTPNRTVISKGIDQPEVLAGILKVTPNALALALNFEARGRDLVLLAHVFELKSPQKIVWAKKYSTSMGVRQTLREAAPLISLNEARNMQNSILLGREPMKFVTRLQIQSFETEKAGGAIQPLLFIEQSLEGEILPLRNQRFGLNVGMTSIRDTYSGWSVGGRYSHLMLAETPSLVKPDLYWFLGLQYMRLQGPGAAVFAENQIDVAKLLGENEDPKSSQTVYQFGFEALIKYRFGIATYLEYFPGLADSKLIAQKSFIVPYQGIGMGLVFQW